MTCRELTSFIADYLAGELSSETARAFEGHLRRCLNCAQYMADYRRAMALGRGAYEDADADARAADVPEPLIAAILAARGGT